MFHSDADVVDQAWFPRSKSGECFIGSDSYAFSLMGAEFLLGNVLLIALVQEGPILSAVI